MWKSQFKRNASKHTLPTREKPTKTGRLQIPRSHLESPCKLKGIRDPRRAMPLAPVYIFIPFIQVRSSREARTSSNTHTAHVPQTSISVPLLQTYFWFWLDKRMSPQPTLTKTESSTRVPHHSGRISLHANTLKLQKRTIFAVLP